jgi:hypothetical protein
MVCRTEAQSFINDLQRVATARPEFADRSTALLTTIS